MNTNYNLETVYTLKQPLSHIGSLESATSFLNTIRVMGDGKPEDVFVYTGNAIRGKWRDCAAMYLLDWLGIKVSKKAFHLLFSGGSIAGDQSVDVEQIKQVRDTLPAVSLFGGGLGNQILCGKLSQTFAYPVCSETRKIVPENIGSVDYSKQALSWRVMTGEADFSRHDDLKATNLDKYCADGTAAPVKGKKDDAPAQMRYTVEYLVPGTQLWHSMILRCEDAELGALVSALNVWGTAPYLGGMANKGFGLVDADISLVIDGVRHPFWSVRDGQIDMSDLAQTALAAYNARLDERRDEAITLLEAMK